ncbi:MAG TPA: hypothetical protein DDY78_21770 [Planctomycetales bacterium]|jgi:hypothetical protein|nr:hypothetical protein [Planctomycetales bacterium]
MEPTQEQIDAIYRKRVLQARRMSPEEKFLAGPRLFDRECQIMRDGFRSERPDATEVEVEAILRQRLALTRRLGNGE